MADANKSIQVTIDVIVDKAKAALNDVAATTVQATKTLDSLNTGSAKGASSLDAMAASGSKGAAAVGTFGKAATTTATQVVDGATKSGKANNEFFTSMSKDVAKGLAAYDLFKAGLRMVVDFLVGSVRAASDADAQLAQLGAVLRSTGEAAGVTATQALDLSKSIERTTAYSDEAVLSAENLLLTFTKIGSDIFPTATQAVVDMSAAMGQDLKSSAIQVGKALQDPILGVSALRRVGVNFNESQQEVIKNLVNTGKAAEAQAMILKELTNEFGGSAAAKLKTFDGQMEHMKNTVDDVQEVLGGGFLVAISDSLTALGTQTDALADSTSAMTVIGKTAYGAGKVVIVAFEAMRVIMVGWSGVATAVAGSFAKGMEGILVGVEAVAKGLNLIGKVSDETVTSIDNLRQGFKETGDKDLTKLIDSSGGASSALKDLETAMTQLNTDGYEEGIKKHQEYVLGQQAAKKAAEEAAAMTQEQKDALKALSDALQGVTDKQSQFAFESGADFTRFGALLTDTKTKQDEWIKSVEQGFDALSSKIKTVNSDITSLTGKIDDARKSFNDFVKSTTTDSAENFAQIVHDAQQAVKTLPDEISKAAASGSDTSDLQKQLKDARSTIKTSKTQEYQDNKQFLDDLAFLNSQDKKNELQQAAALTERKIEIKKKETDDQIAEIQKQIDAATAQRDAYTAAQAAMTLAFGQNVELRKKNSNAEIASLSLLKAAVDQAKSSYDAMAAAATAASLASLTSYNSSTSTSTSKTKRATGGPVGSGISYIVGENGPEMFTPSENGTISPNRSVSAGGDGVVINIINPTVRSDNDLQEIISQVEDVFSRRDELARMGTYK